MSRLLTGTFEEQALAETMWTVAVSPTAVTSATVAPHSGTYCCQFNATGEYIIRGLPSGVTSGTYYTRAYIRVPAWPTTSSIQIVAVGTQTGTWTVAWNLYMVSDGALGVQIGGSNDQSAAGLIALDAWYRLEWKHVVDSSAGSVDVKIFLGDATTELDTLTLSGLSTLATTYGRTRFGRTDATAGTFTIYFDGIAWNDTAGAFENSWCGPGKGALMVLNGDLANAWEDELGAPGTYTKIQKLPAATVSDSTYLVEALTLNSLDRFSLTSLPSEVPTDATIRLLDVYARVNGSQTASAASMKLKLYDENGLSGLTDGPTINCNITNWKVLSFAEHLVVSGAGKSKGDLTAYTVGYDNFTNDATRQRKVSALWVIVEWLESDTPPATPAITHKVLMTA